MLIAVKSKRFSVTGYKRMFVILIKKTLGSGFKYSAFDYCDLVYPPSPTSFLPPPSPPHSQSKTITQISGKTTPTPPTHTCPKYITDLKSVERPGPSFTKLFCRTKLVNAMKRPSTADFVRRIHILNGFVKLAPDQFISINSF